MRLLPFLLLALLAPPSAAKEQAPIEDYGSGAAYQQQLLQAISSADRIVVSEHSNLFDQHDRTTSKYIGPYISYASQELGREQRERLLAAVRNIDAKAGPVPMCLFSPHHAIEFHAGARLQSKLEICFTCGDLYWDALQASHPSDLVGVFATLFAELGFKTEQDWRGKLAAALAADAAAGRAAPPPDPAAYLR